MDNNLPNQQSIPPLPQMSVAKSNAGRNLIVLVSGVLVLIVLAAIGYMLVLGKTQKKVYTAQVYNQPIITSAPTVTPTPPSVYQVNIKDTSNSAIDQDTQATDQSLNNLDTDLNNVDQSFNDQQTNLQ